MAGFSDAQGKWMSKRKNFFTNQVKVDKEVRFASTTIVLDVEEPRGGATIKVLCLERRFRKREIGYVLIDLSQFTPSDRVDRWFKLVEEDPEKKGELVKKGEVRLRIRFTAENPFDESTEAHLGEFVKNKPLSETGNQVPILSFDEGKHQATVAVENFEHGEPLAWVQVEFVRGEVDKLLRKGIVGVRLRGLSPADETSFFSLVCGDQIVLPKLGQYYEFPVTYQPQSNFVKFFLFLHQMSETPIGSSTLTFDDERFLSDWYPFYPRGHLQFVSLPHTQLRTMTVVREPAPLENSGLLQMIGETRILGDSFSHCAPREMAQHTSAADEETASSLNVHQNLFFAASILVFLVVWGA